MNFPNEKEGKMIDEYFEEIVTNPRKHTPCAILCEIVAVFFLTYSVVSIIY